MGRKIARLFYKGNKKQVSGTLIGIIPMMISIRSLENTKLQVWYPIIIGKQKNVFGKKSELLGIIS